ncbi:6404_t:CDS:2 [Ambispora leptoticha]|uniref:6404_t:CDS:1 n=1 Tax=Ambispora leptoticha TaxID=144679 RepID=A0A9N8YXP5_9GLOM|nr:6404_t:CDS:2 [Ambispora leptoticha]
MSKEKSFHEKEITHEKIDFNSLEAHLSLLDRCLVDDEMEIWQTDEKCQKLVGKYRNQVKKTKDESIKWVKLISDALSIGEQEQKKVAHKEDIMQSFQRIHAKLNELKQMINSHFDQHVVDTQMIQFPIEASFLVPFSFAKNSRNQENKSNQDESEPTSPIKDDDGQVELDEKAFRKVLANRIRYNRTKIKELANR